MPALTALLEHGEWQRRAAGVAGLGHSGRRSAIEPLIGALSDKDPVVVKTAWDHLQRLTQQTFGDNQSKWQRWWKGSADGFSFVDHQPVRDDADAGRYDRDDGFRKDPYEAFRGFDVIVLQAERDQLEDTLTSLGIEHTLTKTGQVDRSGLHPRAVFFANCPGKIDEEDARRLDWFVRSGGYLFSTCVALSNTVARLYPDVVRSAGGNGGGAPGGVDATPMDDRSPFLRGVFEEHARPRYQLNGQNFVQAVDPERLEVLLDSPEAFKSYGAGNLAACFRVGHGVVLDSVNHFALQGLSRERFRTPEERMAFAYERLGYTFAQLRDLASQGIFKSQTKAAKACDDLTLFRLVARFVHTKRKSEF